MNKCLTILYFLLISSFVFAEESSQTLKIEGENYVDEFEGIFHYTFSEELTYTTVDKKKLGKSSQPFRGITRDSKTKNYLVSLPWLDKKVNEVLKTFEKIKTLDELKKLKNKKDEWLSFACYGLYDILSEHRDDGGKVIDEKALRKKINEAYIMTGLIFIHKFHNQNRVKAAPKFGSIKKVLQPMMSAFAYGNAWLVISELYDSSKSFSKKGRTIYRDYFLNKPIMMLLRRRFEFPFKEADLSWSILNMNEKVFMSYSRECIRRWIDKKQYKQSKFEKRIKVNKVPEKFQGAEITNDI